jgi:hypothetical protein
VGGKGAGHFLQAVFAKSSFTYFANAPSIGYRQPSITYQIPSIAYAKPSITYSGAVYHLRLLPLSR